MGCCPSFNQNDLSSNIHHADVIGTGGFATIKRGIYLPTKHEIAIKILGIQVCLNRTNGLDMIKNEFHALKLLSTNELCPHLTNLHYAYHDYLNCYLVLDLFLGGDLRYYITIRQHFKETHIAFIIGCVSSALQFIHQNGIIHRDVKPENILFDSKGFPKLTDFGVSYVGDSSSLSCSLSSGTLSYLAPEVLTSSHIHGKGADYWSLGLVMYELLYLSKPWKTHCPKEFVKYIEEYYNGGTKGSRRTSATCHSHDSLDEIPHHPPAQTHSEQSHQSLSLDYHHHSIPFPYTPHSPTYTSFNHSFDYERENQHREPARDLPSSLQVPLNDYSAYGQYLTSECLSVLAGLLDIRIEKRLGGSRSNTQLFFNHLWWTITSTPIEILQQANESLSSIQSPIHIDTETVQETIKWTNQINLIPLLKPEAVFADPSNSYSQPLRSSGNFSLPLPFSNGLHLSFSLKGWREKEKYQEKATSKTFGYPSKSHNTTAVIPMNYADNVMEVLENYFYLGPHSHRKISGKL